ncbi:hypothetical protein SLEP1_g42499 [Rubroshorea leprosula]|uniref:Uncharacterized protein n=1 Tax=Rubroshorea leprosula TaxID=152421 RepID=A0AAV5LBE7_9ROSI|nr:hypothetical protein SLEP1_g42499 [Rubroshorea leprosula]
MSSEETLSIGDSEEVRALEYGDVGMTSESSDLERTKEGVGGSEIVGVEGEGIPITILEVRGRNEGCYDYKADIVSEVRQYESKFRTRDSLGYLVKSYEISSRVLIRPTEVEERACSAPQDNWMPMYAHYLAMGLSLNEDEEEEVGKLVREEGDLVNIMYLNSANYIEAAKLYGLSALSEAEMDKFLSAVGGVAIPKKPRKKLETSTKQASEKGVGRELVPGTSTGVEEVLEFVPRPPPIKLNLELREFEVARAEVRAPGEAKGLVAPLSFRSSFIDAKNTTGAKRFINATFPEVDKRQAKEEVLWYAGATVVKPTLEVNALAQEFVESVKERTLLRRLCEQLGELEKQNESLDKVVPTVKQLEEEKDSLSTKLVFEERKRKSSETSNFVNSNSFDNIVNLYQLPTIILAFTNCKKKVKAKYPEVDVTKITFGEQEEGVEENGERMSADFRPQIKLRSDHDEEERAVFPLNFDYEFVSVEEEEADVEGAEVEESQPPFPMEVYPVSSRKE